MQEEVKRGRLKDGGMERGGETWSHLGDKEQSLFKSLNSLLSLSTLLLQTRRKGGGGGGGGGGQGGRGGGG